MDEKWKKFLHDLASHNVDFIIGNLDRINFGERDFIVKMLIRLILRKAQTALATGNFKKHFKDLWSNLQTIVK